MSVIAPFITELSAAETFEEVRVRGYTLLLAFPPPLLSSTARAELTEALEWSNTRLELLRIAKNSVNDLSKHDYPERIQQSAPSEIVAELIQDMTQVQTAINEFLPTDIEAVWGKIISGPEVKIE